MLDMKVIDGKMFFQAKEKTKAPLPFKLVKHVFPILSPLRKQKNTEKQFTNAGYELIEVKSFQEKKGSHRPPQTK